MKLTELEKNNNKMRRSAIRYMLKLLKDKKTNITVNYECLGKETFFKNDYERVIFDSGNRRLSIEWTEKSKRNKNV